jgi:hypothetical protein
MAEAADSKALTVWNMVLGAALSLPGVRVDRASFLRSAFAAHVPPEVVDRAVAGTPAKAGIPKDTIRKVADSAINWHRLGVSAASAATGLPGGWWLLGSIPADLAQYTYHVIVVLQKLAYLHGWPALFREGQEVDDQTKTVLTVFIGVTMGAKEAADGLTKLAAAFGEQVAKKLPQAPLTKYAVYQVAKQVAKWIGINLTKKKFAEFVGRAVPVVGGAVSGTITWMAFGTGARRLREHLEGLPFADP